MGGAGQQPRRRAASGAGQHNGATSAFDLNTDTQGSIEMKWLYTEFPLPFMPFPTIIRLGAQPFAAAVQAGGLRQRATSPA